MTFFEVIKNYFAPGYDRRFFSPAEDAKILSEIGRESVYLEASDGKKYYYYFPENNANIDVARFLFSRNGIKTSKHISAYYYNPYLALRVKTENLDKNENAKDFVSKIKIGQVHVDSADCEKRLAIVRRHMRGKVK